MAVGIHDFAEDLGDGSQTVKAIVVANENGYGEGLVGPWYEYDNWKNNAGWFVDPTLKNQAFFNDSGADRDEEAYRAYYNWQEFIDMILRFYPQGLDFRGLGGVTVISPSGLLSNIKAFFANFVVCRIIHNHELVLVRRPLAAIPKDGQGMPVDTQIFTYWSDLPANQGGQKYIQITKKTPKQILNQPYYRGEEILIQKTVPWVFGTQHLPYEINPFTLAWYTDKTSASNSALAYLPEKFMTLWLRAMPVNARDGVAEPFDLLCQSSIYPNTEGNLVDGKPGVPDIAKHTVATDWMHEEGREIAEQEETVVTTVAPVICKACVKCYEEPRTCASAQGQTYHGDAKITWEEAFDPNGNCFLSGDFGVHVLFQESNDFLPFVQVIFQKVVFTYFSSF